jgi:hypothetical protein
MNLSEAMTHYKKPAKDILRMVKSGELAGVSPRKSPDGHWNFTVKTDVPATAPVIPVNTELKPAVIPELNPIKPPENPVIEPAPIKNELKEVIKNDAEKRPVHITKKGQEARRPSPVTASRQNYGNEVRPAGNTEAPAPDKSGTTSYFPAFGF